MGMALSYIQMCPVVAGSRGLQTVLKLPTLHSLALVNKQLEYSVETVSGCSHLKNAYS